MTSAGSSSQSPSANAADELERDVDQAIALCDGDLRAALRAMLLANAFLEAEIERLTCSVSIGFTRGKMSPCRRASETLDEWRKIFVLRMPVPEGRLVPRALVDHRRGNGTANDLAKHYRRAH